MIQCVNCEMTEEQIPLLKMLYRGEEFHLCPQCLPVLIHKPHKLAGKLPGLEKLPPPEHEH